MSESTPTPVSSAEEVAQVTGRANRQPVTFPPPLERPAATPPARMPARRVSDVVDNGLWPEFPQRAIEDLYDIDVVIEDFKILHSTDFDNDFAVIKCYDGNNDDFTVANGGTVVLDKLRTLKDQNSLPITGKFVKVEPKRRGGRVYIDLI